MEYVRGQTLSSVTKSYILTSLCKRGSTIDLRQSAVEEASEALLEVVHELTN